MTKSEILFSITKKDFEVQTFRSGGSGGQNQNKRDTGVRIIHRESGAVGESREERSQYANKKTAFHRLTETITFKKWLNIKVMELQQNKTIEQQVEETCSPENIKAEIRENNMWVTVPWDSIQGE